MKNKAGRKPLGKQKKKTIWPSVEPETYKGLEKLAKKHGSMGRAVDFVYNVARNLGGLK